MSHPLTSSVKNLNFNITGNDLYDLFGKYGPIRQIRLGTDTQLKTKGTAYIVYESPDDAKEAMNHLNGFHLMERYIVGESLALPHSPHHHITTTRAHTQSSITTPRSNRRRRLPRRRSEQGSRPSRWKSRDWASETTNRKEVVRVVSERGRSADLVYE